MNHLPRPRSTFWPRYAPVVTWTIIGAYILIGVGLTLQPDRFANTPSYANLITFAPSEVWGCGYLLVAGLLLAWRMSLKHRALGILAHTTAFILTAWWLGAFVVRYGTDNGTTIVNVVSWAVYLSLVIRSAAGVDDEPC